MVEVNPLQLIVDSLLTGGVYSLIAVGLTLLYRILKFPNFAHAEFVTLGAYVAFIFNVSLGMSLLVGGLAAFLTTGLVGVVAHRLIFRQLSTRGAMPMMIASIGLGLVFRHSIQEVWGAKVNYYRIEAPAIYEFLGARATSLDLTVIGVSLALIWAVHLLLTRTRLGKAMRATADNVELARVSGIDTEKVILAVWFLSAGLAAIGGVLRAADTRLIPLLGWNLLLPAFAVVVLGGIGSFYGTVLAAYILGFAENIGVLLLLELGLSTGYRPAIAFATLILMLLIRPQGLFALSSEGR
jgi:branched-subunit amino acid ABC-type transport system permease component